MNNTRIIKPWGWYETINEGHEYLVKIIFVAPNQRFSLQYHVHREELWSVLEGSGTAIVENSDELNNSLSSTLLTVGSTITIPKLVNHRMKAGPQGVKFLEIQRGHILSENDIVRLEDDYNRK